MEAQWSPQWSAQWTLPVGQRRHSGGTREAEASHKLAHNVIYNWTNYFTGRPATDPCASIMRPRRCACLPSATLERHVSDRPLLWPLGDCLEYAKNFTVTMASMVRSERPPCHPWTTKATFLPPLRLQRRPGQFCGLHKGGTKLTAPVWRGISFYYGPFVDIKHNIIRPLRIICVKCFSSSGSILSYLNRWWLVFTRKYGDFLFTPQPSGLEGYCRTRAGERLPDFAERWSQKPLDRFLLFKVLWNNLGLPMDQKLYNDVIMKAMAS